MRMRVDLDHGTGVGDARGGVGRDDRVPTIGAGIDVCKG